MLLYSPECLLRFGTPGIFCLGKNLKEFAGFSFHGNTSKEMRDRESVTDGRKQYKPPLHDLIESGF